MEPIKASLQELKQLRSELLVEVGMININLLKVALSFLGPKEKIQKTALDSEAKSGLAAFSQHFVHPSLDERTSNMSAPHFCPSEVVQPIIAVFGATL